MIDSSDVLVYVVDARDPMGTRCVDVPLFLISLPAQPTTAT